MTIPISYSNSVDRGTDDVDDDDDDEQIYDNFFDEYACRMLERSNVPFVVWFLNVEAFYRRRRFCGSTFHILVHDVGEAAGVLQKYGWQVEPLPPVIVRYSTGEALTANPRYVEFRMHLPTLTVENQTAAYALLSGASMDPDTIRDVVSEDFPTSMTLVLLQDSEWHFDVETHWREHGGGSALSRNRNQQRAIIVPPLHQYVDALITSELEDKETFQCSLPGLSLTELYYFDHKNTTLPALQDPNFVDKLSSPANRQWHLQGLTGEVWDRDMDDEEREARQAARMKYWDVVSETA